MLWSSDADLRPLGAGEGRARLIAAFDKSGLRLAPGLERRAALRIEEAGETEWSHFEHLHLGAVPALRAKHLLGAGHALTEFLIAPSCSSLSGHAAVCSLGALANLMVVICDALLDNGAVVEDVLPPNELARGGGNGSEVMLLLEEYFRRLKSLGAQEEVLESARRVMERMFEAEIATVRQKAALPFQFWLRKSSLPFVLMATPAWAAQRERPGYLRWLYEVGRLFGAIDDAVDMAADATSGHPNYWLRAGDNVSEPAALRADGRARKILAFWDNLVPDADERAVVRASFLYNVWRWLEPV